MANHPSSVKSLVVAAVLAVATGEMAMQLFAVSLARASAQPAVVHVAPPAVPLPQSGGEASVDDIGPGMAEPLLVGSPNANPAPSRGLKSRGVR